MRRLKRVREASGEPDWKARNTAHASSGLDLVGDVLAAFVHARVQNREVQQAQGGGLDQRERSFNTRAAQENIYTPTLMKKGM